MTLKSCAPIVGVDVISFDTEREVLLAWRVFVLAFAVFINKNKSLLYHVSQNKIKTAYEFFLLYFTDI